MCLFTKGFVTRAGSWGQMEKLGVLSPENVKPCLSPEPLLGLGRASVAPWEDGTRPPPARPPWPARQGGGKPFPRTRV